MKSTFFDNNKEDLVLSKKKIRQGESVNRRKFLLLPVFPPRLARQNRGWKIYLWKVCR